MLLHVYVGVQINVGGGGGYSRKEPIVFSCSRTKFVAIIRLTVFALFFSRRFFDFSCDFHAVGLHF